jgi:hypothetical protein
MQVTVDVPDQLAARLRSHEDELADIIESGLRLREWAGISGLANEVINFLATGPDPKAIVAFHPSETGAARVRELLDRNREGALNPTEKAELDEMALLDHFMTLIKARTFEKAKAA